ncbi:cell division protein FtsQ/DivIB [Methylobacterium soli]|uniref:Cell division protein FtsQ n=1 Tax=Methylobacterium soli TaxID=553447 RepID=A0A6L3SS61_9HYPH|nr:cell division protein FtsQ/DivIB [Methylobacterium soli]KAB1076366.1 FtsQ-type POTRA domain-containing protein [Methylobacterium soli]GJE43643.1 Cell division protein FtsQ [Methylobacterium soli]
MDGGGRNVGSLTPAGYPGGEGPRAGLLARLPRFLRRAAPRRVRPALPIAQRVPRHIGVMAVSASFAVVAVAGFVTSGRYEAFVAEQGRPLDILARIAGFGVERVTISGISRMYEREVLAAAGIDWRSSVLFLDVNEVRERLIRVPLIASASVRKLYPNEIVINQVEREPAALWQKNGEISVIAADGTVIDTMRDDRYASLPLVVGDDANTKLSEYLGLIAAAGALGDRIRAGTYVSGRRWTLKLDGVDIRLPETGSAEALARLVKLERDARILEKDVIAVDLRMPDRVVVRLTEEAAAARAESQKKTKKGTAT